MDISARTHAHTREDQCLQIRTVDDVNLETDITPLSRIEILSTPMVKRLPTDW